MFKIVAGAAFLVIALPAIADAQFVRVGPLGGVNVRVPFVSVDVSPWGDTAVRAPFTAVNAPGRRFPRLRGGQRRLPLRRLRERRLGADRFTVPGGYPYGPRHYGAPPPELHRVPRVAPTTPLGGPPIEVLPESDSSAPRSSAPRSSAPRSSAPESARRAPLERPQAPRYHIPSYSDVFPEAADAPSSAETGEARNPEAVARDRLAERLRRAAGRLQQSLAAREDDTAREESQVWIDYLQPEELTKLAEDLARAREVSLEQARELRMNFDAVAANPSLDYVMRLRGFEDARQALTDLVSVLEASDEAAAQSPGDASSQPLPDDLPNDLPDDIVPPADDFLQPADDVAPPASSLAPPANAPAGDDDPADAGDTPADQEGALPAPMPDPQSRFRGEV